MDIEFTNSKHFIEGVCIEDLIKSQQTPFYTYSQSEIMESYKNLSSNLPGEIFFSVKANSNQAILKLMNNCGAGADVVSIGELERALTAGFKTSDIIFEGVGKSKQDIEYAIKKNIRLINTESINELILINSIGKSLNKIINVGIRLNPNIEGKTLDKISTGKKTDKFGIDISKINEIILSIKSFSNINVKGISCHIGSQIKDLSIFEQVFIIMKKTADLMNSENIDIKYVDLGGGFAVDYDKKLNDLNIKKLGNLVSSIFSGSEYQLSFEPGRYLVAKSGILITKILTCKENGGVNFLITDAGMQTLIRPAMYNSYHRIEALNKDSNERITYTIAGPICESSDILAKDLILPKQETDNFLIILDTGAYGATMASNYNSRGLPTEILIYKNNYSIIYLKEDISEIINKENIPSWLTSN